MAQGSYLVHERLPDAAGSREARSGVECLECGHMAPACEFDPIMAYASTARNESTKVGGAGDGQEHDA